MSIQVRDLLPKVMVHRPDLDNERGMWALRESALRVAKETLLATNDTATYVEPNSRIFTPVVSGEQIIRFSDLKTASPDGITEFVGDYNAFLKTPKLPVPLAATVGTDDFITVGTALPARTRKFSSGRYAAMENGDLYVTNGELFFFTGQPAGELLKYSKGTWSTMADPPVPRGNQVTSFSGSYILSNNEMVVLDDGRIVDFGGGCAEYVGGSYNANERGMCIYDPSTNAWTDYVNCFPYVVAVGCQYFYMGGTEIAVYSGCSGDVSSGATLGKQTTSGLYGNIIVFDVDTLVVTATIPLPFTSRTNAGSTMSHVMLNADEVIFIVGKVGDDRNYSVWKFTISTRTFTRICTTVDSGQASYAIRNATIVNNRYLVAINSYAGSANISCCDLTTGTALSPISLANAPGGYQYGAIGVDSGNKRVSILGNTGYYSFYVPESNTVTTPVLVTGGASVSECTPAVLNGAPFVVGGIITSPYQRVTYFNIRRVANIGQSYLVTTPGNGLYAGDILTSDGTNWNVTTTTGYQNTYQANIPSNNMAINGKVSDGVTSWAQDNGSIYWYGDTENGFFAKTKYSYVPTDRDFDKIGLPTEAEDAIVEGALELIYMMPGQGRDPNQATYYRRTYKTAVSQLRAVQMFGYGGSPTFNAPYFAGRPTIGTGW